MAIVQRDVAYTAGATGTLPSAQSGDVLLAFAFRDGTATPPGPMSGWTVINQGSASSLGSRVFYRVWQAGDVAPTFANATAITIASFSGVDTGSPVGGSDAASAGTSDTITIQALTLAKADGTSVVTAGYCHRNSLGLSTPDSMTEYVDQAEATTGRAGYSISAPVSTFAARTSSAGLSGSWRSIVVELLAASASTTVTGTAQGTSSATAGSVQVSPCTGSATATSAATADSVQVAIRTGTAQATGSASATSVQQSIRTGTASATSSATASAQQGGGPVTVTGTASATASTSSVSVAAYATTGTAQATSTATAGTVQVAVRTAAATGTSTATARVLQVAVRAATALAASSATATAVGSGGYIPAPPGRTVQFPAETRVLTVPAEPRTLTVRSTP